MPSISDAVRAGKVGTGRQAHIWTRPVCKVKHTGFGEGKGCCHLSGLWLGIRIPTASIENHAPVGDQVPVANRYTSCRVSSAQLMRAFLFATATIARLWPRSRPGA